METERLLLEQPSFSAWWYLARAYHSYAAVLTRFFEEEGITGSQFGVLRCLADAGSDGLMLSDLSKRLMVTCGNTTGVVDRLEQAGYLRRERRADDRRVVFAHLTPEGSALYQKLLPACLELNARLMGALALEEKEALAGICSKLHHSIEEFRRPEAGELDSLIFSLGSQTRDG